VITPIVVGPKFCPVAEQGAGRPFSIPSAARQAFAAQGFGKGVVSLRDRALAQIYALRTLPLGAIVNARRMDYNGKRGVLKVTLRKGAAPKNVKLSRAARSALNQYLKVSGVARASTDPLFVRAVNRGKALDATSAMCAREIRGLLTKRSRFAKVSVRGISAR
jgi:hypothetical protein